MPTYDEYGNYFIGCEHTTEWGATYRMYSFGWVRIA